MKKRIDLNYAIRSNGRMAVLLLVVQEALGFRQMRLLVRFQNGRTRERLAAQMTRKRALPGVHPAVVLHVVTQFERLAAIVAPERPLLTVLSLLVLTGRLTSAPARE